PGYRQWATHPDGPHTLLLPLDKAEIFTSALANLGENERVTWDRYQVQSGDTLIGIAKRFRTQVNALQRANNISGSRIIAGEFLLIPRAYDPSQPLLAPNAPEYTDGIAYSSELLYQVKSGDSLARIARRYGVSVEALAEWNEISLEGLIHPGQELTIRPEQTSLN